MGASLVRADARSLPLADASVDLIVTSPPYFALRSYTDGGEHFDGQLGSEPTPQEFLESLWAVTAECARVLKPTGSMFVNLGDKYAGSGGHNNAGVSTAGSTLEGSKQQDRTGPRTNGGPVGATSKLHKKARVAADQNRDTQRDRRKFDGGGEGRRAEQRTAARRQAPDRYNQSASFGEVTCRAKSLMGLPWRYAVGCIDQLGLILRAEIIWSKPNGLPESVTDRVRRSHEQWFHLTKEGRYFSGVDEIREPHTAESLARSERNRFAPDLSQEGVGSPNTLDPADCCNPLGKLPNSVWVIPTEPLYAPPDLGVDHFAAFPQEWPRRLILGWSPSGICMGCYQPRLPVTEEPYRPNGHSTGRQKRQSNDSQGAGWNKPGYPQAAQSAAIVGYSCSCPNSSAPTRPSIVLDPFCGTGTVPMVARALGRFGIGVDLSRDYLRLADWRVFRSGHAAKSVSRTDRERQGVLI